MMVMKNRFDSILDSGLEEADKVQSNLSEIYEVFNELDNSIKKKVGGEFSLILETTSGGEIFFDMITKKMDKLENYELRGSLILKSNVGALKVCKWRRTQNGYPLTLINDMTQYECYEKDTLIEALGDIFSSGALWLKVKKTLNSSNSQAKAFNASAASISDKTIITTDSKVEKDEHSEPE